MGIPATQNSWRGFIAEEMHVVGGGIRAFSGANRKLAFAATPDSWSSTKLHDAFDDMVGELINRQGCTTVLDIGAGRESSYIPLIRDRATKYLIGIDVDKEELSRNQSLDRAIVADACSPFDLPTSSVDLVLAKSVVEHLPNVRAFLRNVDHVLRPNGLLVVFFPGKHAPFAILNRILPERAKDRILANLMPGHEGIVGFKIFYDNTVYSAFNAALLETGFVREDERVSYFSSSYFAFFLPVYAFSLLLDLTRAALGVKELASYYIFVARKR
jgi:SAM-dependent methyltransferase